jgi:arylsulfatase A-like enzyme
MRPALHRTAVALALLGLACSANPDRPDGRSPAPATPSPALAPPRLPHVIVMSVDTLRADRLGADGHDRPTSPAVDAFAAESLLFERAISQAPSTTPAHMSMFTGLTPSVHGVVNLDQGRQPLNPGIPTLPRVFRDAGYLIAGLHGGGNMDGSLGFDRGFHVWADDLTSFHWTEAWQRPADLDAIRSLLALARSRGRPLFLFLHHYVCHVPYVKAPQELRERFLEGVRVAGLPAGLGDETRRKAAARLAHLPDFPERLWAVAKARRADMRDFWKGVDLSDPDHRAHMLALYDSSVAFSDHLFSIVRRILEAEGAWDEAIVVFTSDHGEEFHEHGGREHGRLFVEHLRVPLIVKFERSASEAPRRVTRAVRTMDLLPTLLAHLGIGVPQPIQGVSFMPLLGGPGSYDPPIVSYGGRSGEWLRLEAQGASFTEEGGQSPRLFDLASDPAEQRDLAAAEPARAARLAEAAAGVRTADEAFRARLDATARDAPAIDPALVEVLRSLGYLE